MRDHGKCCFPIHLTLVSLSTGVTHSFQPRFSLNIESFDKLQAGINPALETFKSKKTGSSFYPGKGMRDHGKSGRLLPLHLSRVVKVNRCNSLISFSFLLNLRIL
jgi:hypothetical protein